MKKVDLEVNTRQEMFLSRVNDRCFLAGFQRSEMKEDSKAHRGDFSQTDGFQRPTSQGLFIRPLR